ncbi:sugar kinase [Paenalkalicoccus suaedae]|uniref:Sugar kinase n=1 Tax=Paenalkalicoccus suaedae TaxID=2592382 RepID=A0A859FH87_9BACI|nr:sugar kinase [Paenalkalicoccus suaedae]QKS72497.1 sugar kinase [Paenalkalicoccus suaedae]
MARVVTLGEMLMRLQTPDRGKLSQASTFNAYFGGAEANVAIGLSHLGHDVRYVTALPSGNPLAHGMKQHLQRAGVHVDWIYEGGSRIGAYYIEEGYSLKASSVVYDRAHSSVLELASVDVDWAGLFADVDWFHVSGITCALSNELHTFVKVAMQEAHAHEVKVSFDCNYRSKLWSAEEAGAAYLDVLPYVDHCFAGWKDFAWLFKWEAEGETYEEQLKAYYDRLRDEYGVASCASTKREIVGNNRHELRGYFYDGTELVAGETVAFDVIDRIGGGDSFAAGVLHGMSGGDGIDANTIIEFAVAYSVLNHFVRGDQSDYTVADVTQFIQNQSGDVVR